MLAVRAGRCGQWGESGGAFRYKEASMLPVNESSAVIVRIVAYPGEIYRLARGRTLCAV